MKHRHEDGEECDARPTPWAIVFLREQDGAIEAMEKMKAAMEDCILHGTDDESDDVLAALTIMHKIASMHEQGLPDALMRLGNMAAKRRAVREHNEILGVLDEMGGEDDNVMKAMRGLIEALIKRDDPEGESFAEGDEQAAVKAIEAMFANFGEPKEGGQDD